MVKKKIKKNDIDIVFVSAGELVQKLRWTEVTDYIYCSSQKLVSSLLEYSWTLNLYIALFQSKTLLFTPLLAASQIKYVPLQVRFSS